MSKHLKPDQKQAIRGYLQLEAKTLLKDGTIAFVNLPELDPLMPKCHVVLIESDEGQKVEFKLVFRETKGTMCTSKVLQEHILLNFEINPKVLKTQKGSKETAGKGDEAGTGGDANQ